jgi:hypothetical protein
MVSRAAPPITTAPILAATIKSMVPWAGSLVFAVALAASRADPAPSPTHSPAPAASGPTVLLDRIAAVVGDDIVFESEVRKLVETGVHRRLAGESDAAYRDRILEERIVDLLRERQLRRTGRLDPDPAEVEARLAELEARVAKEQGVPFAAILARARVTREEVADWVRRGLALEVYARERILPTIKISEADLRAFYEGPFRAEAAKRKLEAVPPFETVTESLREALREQRLNEEIQKWTEQLRSETRVLIYRR